MTTGSRQAILEKIRNNNGERARNAAADYAALARTYTMRGELTPESTLALMVQRLREYDAEVVECAEEEIFSAIAKQIAASGRRVLAAPAGLPKEWLAQGVDWRIDNGLMHEQIEEAEGVLTAAFCGIADSGTIALHHSAAEGRRVLTLLPDWHLCVLRASQVVETLPEYFARCTEPPRVATYISGPSATADIEMTRIKGVHGPRFLHVLLVRDEH